MSRWLSLVVLCLLPCLAGRPAHAAWGRLGQTPSGAVYRMAIPEGWRPGDGVVVYQHDFMLERDLAPDLGPLAALQLQQGFAVIASGYAQAGWAVFTSRTDNRELLERFRADVGEPGRVLAWGTGMGGLIALQMAQDPHLAVDGVLALCPFTAGHQRWESALDVRVLYDAVCSGVAGGELPAAADQPWLLDAVEISAAGLSEVVARAGRCLGAGVEPAQRDPAQQTRLDVFMAHAGLPHEAAVLPSLAWATLGLSDLLRDRGKLGGAIAVGNTGVDYGDPALNARVRRIQADAFAALELRLRSGVQSGGQARVVSLHARGDGLVDGVHQAWLRRQWPAARLASAIVDAEAAGGCALSPAEVQAGWEALRAWTSGDVTVPDAVDLQARCLELVAAGEAAGECRIDPGLQPQAGSASPPGRNPAMAQPDGRFSGAWQDPDHPGEWWLLELLDGDTALLYGLTYAAPGESGDQYWLTGSGRVSGDGIAFDEVHSLSGSGFGHTYDPAGTAFQPWGQVRVVFDGCGRGRLRYRARAPFGTGGRDLEQVQGLAGQDCTQSPGRKAGLAALSGSWYDPQGPGQGVVLNVNGHGGASLALLGYDPVHGQPVWLQGRGLVDALGRGWFGRVQRPHGPDFGGTQAPRAEDWGRIEIDFPACDRAVLRYQGRDPRWGRGRIELRRLTWPLGVGDCGL